VGAKNVHKGYPEILCILCARFCREFCGIFYGEDAGHRVLLDTSLLVAASVEEHPIHAGFFGKRLDADLQLTLALTRLEEIVGEGV
jgi:hypothetical protein